MYALLNADIEQYVSIIAPQNHEGWTEWTVSFSGDESDAFRWEEEAKALDVLDWLYEISAIPEYVDMRIAEVSPW